LKKLATGYGERKHACLPLHDLQAKLAQKRQVAELPARSDGNWFSREAKDLLAMAGDRNVGAILPWLQRQNCSLLLADKDFALIQHEVKQRAESRSSPIETLEVRLKSRKFPRRATKSKPEADEKMR
jgi:hypothetical protein